MSVAGTGKNKKWNCILLFRFALNRRTGSDYLKKLMGGNPRKCGISLIPNLAT